MRCTGKSQISLLTAAARLLHKMSYSCSTFQHLLFVLLIKLTIAIYVKGQVLVSQGTPISLQLSLYKTTSCACCLSLNMWFKRKLAAVMLALFILYACMVMYVNCMWLLDEHSVYHIQPEQSHFLLPVNLSATAESFLLMQGWTLHPCISRVDTPPLQHENTPCFMLQCSVVLTLTLVKPVRSKVKTSFSQWKAFRGVFHSSINKKMPSSSDKTATIAAPILISFTPAIVYSL